MRPRTVFNMYTVTVCLNSDEKLILTMSVPDHGHEDYDGSWILQELKRRGLKVSWIHKEPCGI